MKFLSRWWNVELIWFYNKFTVGNTRYFATSLFVIFCRCRLALYYGYAYEIRSLFSGHFGCPIPFCKKCAFQWRCVWLMIKTRLPFVAESFCSFCSHHDFWFINTFSVMFLAVVLSQYLIVSCLYGCICLHCFSTRPLFHHFFMRFKQLYVAWNCSAPWKSQQFKGTGMLFEEKILFGLAVFGV